MEYAKSLEILRLSLTHLSQQVYQKDIVKYDDSVNQSIQDLEDLITKFQILDATLLLNVVPIKKRKFNYSNKFVNKYYCTCGEELYSDEYSFKKPKFCPECGSKIRSD